MIKNKTPKKSPARGRRVPTAASLGSSLTHRERITNLIAGKAVDRPPVTFWRHFYHRENAPETLAEALATFQKKFDWDLVKINPRASYHIEDWGAKYRFSKDEFTKPGRLEYPIHVATDWENLEVLTPTRGTLGEQLQAIRLVAKRIGPTVPKVMTVFTPLSIAGDLVGQDEHLVRYIREYPLLLKPALEVIAETFERFAVECLSAGADGVFLATTEWASGELLSPEEYQEFDLPYARRVAEAVKNAGGLVVLHVCKSQNFLHLFSAFPADIVNWDAADSTNLKLKQGATLLKRPVLGGFDYKSELTSLSPKKATEVAQKRLQENRSIRFILGPGCAIPPETPEAVLFAIRRAVEGKIK